jgi:hypothetical protein
LERISQHDQLVQDEIQIVQLELTMAQLDVNVGQAEQNRIRDQQGKLREKSSQLVKSIDESLARDTSERQDKIFELNRKGLIPPLYAWLMLTGRFAS